MDLGRARLGCALLRGSNGSSSAPATAWTTAEGGPRQTRRRAAARDTARGERAVAERGGVLAWRRISDSRLRARSRSRTRSRTAGQRGDAPTRHSPHMCARKDLMEEWRWDSCVGHVVCLVRVMSLCSILVCNTCRSHLPPAAAVPAPAGPPPAPRRASARVPSATSPRSPDIHPKSLAPIFRPRRGFPFFPRTPWLWFEF